MKKLLIKLLYKLLGFRTSPPCLIDGNEFIIKFNNQFYIMVGYTLEQKANGTDNISITFTDMLSSIDNKNKEKRWDY